MMEVLAEVERRLELVRKYYANYLEYLKSKNYSKASGMLWGAINNLVCILSLLRGLEPPKRHWEVVRALEMEVPRLDLPREYPPQEYVRACDRLHSNFLHDWMAEEDFEGERIKAEALMKALEGAIGEELRKLKMG